MHPRTTELLKYIDDQTAELQSAFESIPPDRRGTPPAPGRWSPAEVVHHVALVDRRLVQLLRSLIERAKSIEPERDESSVLAIIDPRRHISRVTRIVTAPATEPRDTNAATVWTDLEQSRRALRDVILTGDGLALGAVSAVHPALGELSGYGWIAFVGSHAGRHAAQIREDSLT